MGLVKVKESLSVLTIFFSISISSSQTMAVMEFEGKGVSQTEASALTDRLNNEIYKLGKYTLVERNQINEILNEQGFQQSGCTSNECVVEVGRLLGAGKMVAGSISKVGTIYSVSARVVDMESGQIEQFANLDHEGSIGDLLKWGMEQIALKLITGKRIKPHIQTPSRYGSLYITTKPSDAVIWLDDEPIEKVTPVTIEKLLEGQHVIRAESGNYGGVHQVQVKPNEINRTHLKLELYRNNLNIYSTPAGADVYYENIKKGVTPFTIKNLNVGNHIFRVSKNGYVTVEKTVNVVKNQVGELKIILKKQPRITVTAIPPNSRFLVDKKILDKYSVLYENLASSRGTILSLEPGNYRLTIRNDFDYEDWVEEFSLEPEEMKIINAELKRKKGIIIIDGPDISNANISIGSFNTVITLPNTVKDIPTGSVKILVSHPDHLSYEKKIDVLWKKSTTVTVNMPSILSLEKRLNSNSKMRNYLLIGAIVSVGLGGYFKYSAEKHYDEYSTATSNVGDLHQTIELEDQLNQIFTGLGGISFIPATFYQGKIIYLKKLLNDRIIKG